MTPPFVALVEGNAGLVQYVVSRMESFRAAMGLDRDDMIAEGNLALLLAAQRYDPTKGYAFSTFSTFAVNYIRCTILKMDRGNRAKIVGIGLSSLDLSVTIRSGETTGDTLVDCLPTGKPDPAAVVAGRVLPWQEITEGLSLQEAEVVRLALVEELKGGSIAAALRVSTSEVSRLKLSAIAKISARFSRGEFAELLGVS